MVKHKTILVTKKGRQKHDELMDEVKAFLKSKKKRVEFEHLAT